MTNNKTYIKFIIAESCMFLFVLWTLILGFVDQQAVGPNGSIIGLGGFNNWFKNLVGQSDLFLKISDILLYVTFAFVLFFVGLGVYQMFARKSIKKVDKQLYILAVFYAIVVVFYIFFEICEINFRPVLVDGVLEASYPSSHVLFAVCICLSSAFMFKNMIEVRWLKNTIFVILVVLATIVVVSRALSGIHWITDIIASMLLCASLTFALDAVFDVCKME